MSPSEWKESLLAGFSGAVFAAGLALSGMTEPSKVLGFLDFTGDWDPSLMFVMGGAIAVTFTAFRLVPGRAAPFLGGKFHVPSRRDLDLRLLLGAALFGIGWGVGGYCPGPGLTSIATGSAGPLVFVLAMALGMRAYDRVEAARQAKHAISAGTSAA